MFFKKSKPKNAFSNVYRYYESKDTVFDILKYSLQSIGWLSMGRPYKGATNLMKIGTKTFKGEIAECDDDKLIIKMEHKGVGTQEWDFIFEDGKRGCALEIATNFTLNNANSQNTKQIISSLKKSFGSTTKDLDSLVRDELINRGLKGFF